MHTFETKPYCTKKKKINKTTEINILRTTRDNTRNTEMG
jgi:hypothetical protein